MFFELQTKSYDCAVMKHIYKKNAFFGLKMAEHASTLNHPCMACVNTESTI